MAVPAESFDVALARAPGNVLVKWQTIQDEIASFPRDALRDLIAQLSWMLRESDHRVTDEIVAVIDDWYRQALAVRANRRDGIGPVLTEEDFLKLPERSF